MPYCSVNNCQNQTGKNKRVEGVVIHTFPRKLQRIKQWLRCIGRHRIRHDVEDLDAVAQLILHGGNNSSFRICSSHFAPQCYISTKKKRRSLRHDAVPTVFTAGNEKPNWSNFPTETAAQLGSVSVVHASTSTDCHENMEDKGVQWPEFEFNEGGEPWKIQHDHIYHSQTTTAASSQSAEGASKLQVICLDLGPWNDQLVSPEYKPFGSDGRVIDGHEETSGQNAYGHPYNVQHPSLKCQNYPPTREKDQSHMTEIILNLALEIIYLLTGEDFTILKKSGEQLTPNLHPSRIHDRKVLEVTQKMIKLLTGEVPIRCQDVSVYLSMEEWEYLEEHKDLYKDLYKGVMMEDLKSLNSLGKRKDLEGNQFMENVGKPCRSAGVDRSRSRDFPDDGTSTFISIKEEALDEENIEVLVVEEAEIQCAASPALHNSYSLHHTCLVNPVDLLSYKSPDLMNSLSYNEERHFRKIYNCPSSRDKDQKPSVVNEVNKEGAGAHSMEDSRDSSKTRLGSLGQSMEDSPDQCVNPEPMLAIKQEEPSSKDERCEIKTVERMEELHRPEGNPAEGSTRRATMSIINADGTIMYIKTEDGDNRGGDTTTDPTLSISSPPTNVCDSNIRKHAEGAKGKSDLPQTMSRDATCWSKKLQRAREAGRPFTCALCGRSFACGSALETHGRVHAGKKPFSCSKCSKSFMRIAGLCAHEKFHSREQLFQCAECGKCFASKSHLGKHQAIHAGKGHGSRRKDRGIGGDDGSDFGDQGRVRGESYLCSKGGALANQEDLPQPCRPLPMKKPYSCKQCGRCFEAKCSLVLHQKSHREKQPLPCPYCQRSFQSRSHLERHKRIHTGEKPFPCSYCGKTFSNRSGATVHQRIHTGEKPYSCSVCGRSFTDLSGLVVHKRKHEPAGENV